MATTETNPSLTLSFRMAMKLMTNNRTMRPMPMALFAEEAAQGIHIGGDAFDQVTGRRGGVIGEAQALDVVEEEVAQAARNSLGGVGCQASGKERESAFDEAPDRRSRAQSRRVVFTRLSPMYSPWVSTSSAK